MPSLRPAVFLDRDGVINENRDNYILSWADVEFLPGVFESLRQLADSDFVVVMVTNQSAVGRGLVTLEAVVAINDGIVARVGQENGRIDRSYICPHRPDEDCQCRKPRPGMLLRAAQELGIDLRRSYLIGDAVTDVEAALRAGCVPILVLTGRGERQRAGLHASGYDNVAVLPALPNAVDWILAARSEDLTNRSEALAEHAEPA